jgi:hypothetical protein
MNKITKIIAMLALATGLAVSSGYSQTSTNAPAPPPTPQAFYNSVIDYFSSNDTTLQFTKFKMWTEGDYQNNINFADKIAASIDLYTTDSTYTNAVAIGAEGGMRNAGVAGTIVDGTFGAVLSYNVHAIRLEGYVDGGYSAISSEGFAEIGFRAEKKLTPNTFAGLSMGLQIPTTPANGPAYPIIGVLVGVTF